MQQSQTPNTIKPDNIAVHFLPSDPTSAMHKMISTSKRLLDLAERETQSLLQNDVLSFGVLQDEKDAIVDQYAAMSMEFRNRIKDFRRIEKPLLHKLEKIQNDLGAKSKANNELVEKIQAKAAQNTHDTLYTAQELAQKNPVRMTGRNETNQQGE